MPKGFLTVFLMCGFFTAFFLLLNLINYIKKSNTEYFDDSRIDWKKIVVILSGELALTLFVFCCYPILSMLCLGEGGGSLLYAIGNRIGWAIVPISLPTIINLHNIFRALRNETLDKLRIFKLIQFILLILYFPFLVWWYVIDGFVM